MKLIPLHTLNSFPLYQLRFTSVIYQVTSRNSVTPAHTDNFHFVSQLTTPIHIDNLVLHAILLSHVLRTLSLLWLTQVHFPCSLLFQHPKVIIPLDRHGLTLRSLLQLHKLVTVSYYSSTIASFPFYPIYLSYFPTVHCSYLILHT